MEQDLNADEHSAYLKCVILSVPTSSIQALLPKKSVKPKLKNMTGSTSSSAFPQVIREETSSWCATVAVSELPIPSQILFDGRCGRWTEHVG